MPAIYLKLGKENVRLEMPTENLIGVLKGNFEERNISEYEETVRIEQALQRPIGTGRLSSLVKRRQKVAILVSDITRPVPTRKLLPPLIRELYRANIPDKDIKIVFGMGIHRPHTIKEQRDLVGERIFNTIECADSTKEGYIHVGKTTRGTPLNISNPVVEANIRICTGNIEYHYFAGYSGGAKAIMPGAADYETIKSNHGFQLDKNAQTGKLEGNPVREDIEEVAEKLRISFILNVVLNENKQILQAFAGHHLKAHRVGCEYLDRLYRVDVPELADIVVVSAGGYPKDINLYQAQKALDNASHAVKPGGIIILVAKCDEGYGNDTFAQWIKEADTPRHLEERLKHTFVLGGHKAAAIARVVKRAEVFMVTAMAKPDVEATFFTKKPTVQKALEDALSIAGDGAKVLVIPQGGSILPKCGKGTFCLPHF